MDDLPTLCKGSRQELLLTGETQEDISAGPTRIQLYWVLVLIGLGGCLEPN